MRAVLQQPKRLALLVYLATAAHGRPVRRDTLLARFWPDLDQEHARAALRRALYFLRQACGADLIIGRGDDEVAVDIGALWCDATDFDAAIDRNDWIASLELYQGHFLDGFYVQGAPEAEGWIDRERSRRRYDAALAAWQLARHALPDTGPASRWAERAVELAPTDEDAALAFVQQLEHLGERHLALRLIDLLTGILAAEHDQSPAADLLAAADRLRASLAGPAGPPPTGDRIVVAVCPFMVRGDPGIGYLAEGMVDLVSTKLDGTGAIRTADPKAVLRQAGPAAATGADLETGQRIARALGAGLFVVGTILESGGRIEAAMGLYEADGRLRCRAEGRAEAEGSLFELIDELIIGLMTGFDGSASGRLARLAALTTSSLPALRSYLQGEHEFRHGRHLQALDQFRRATALDPSFALAYYRLASSLAAAALIGPAREASADAHRHRGRLSDHDRWLIEAQHAWLEGHTSGAERRYAVLTSSYPEQVEPWFLLGDLLVHTNPCRGRSIVEAREPLERALALEPGHIGALTHLARIASLEGRRDDLTRLAELALAQSPGADQALALEALVAIADGDVRAREAVAERLPLVPGLAMARAFTDAALYGGDLEGALGFGEAGLAAARSAEFLALGNVVLAHLDAARGLPAAGLERLHLARRHEPAWGLETLGLWAAAPFDLMGTAERDAIEADLAAWDADAVPAGVAMPLVFHDGLHGHFRLFLLGLLAARRAETGPARVHAAGLAELAVTPGAEILIEQLVRTLDAAILRAEDRWAEALAVLERLKRDVWFQFAVGSPFFAGGLTRFLRADLLETAGRTAEAIEWWETMAQRSPYELVFAEEARTRAAAARRRLS